MTVPAEVRETGGVRIGDVLMFGVTGRGAGQFRVLRTTCGSMRPTAWTGLYRPEDVARDAVPRGI